MHDGSGGNVAAIARSATELAHDDQPECVNGAYEGQILGS